MEENKNAVPQSEEFSAGEMSIENSPPANQNEEDVAQKTQQDEHKAQENEAAGPPETDAGRSPESGDAPPPGYGSYSHQASPYGGYNPNTGWGYQLTAALTSPPMEATAQVSPDLPPTAARAAALRAGDMPPSTRSLTNGALRITPRPTANSPRRKREKAAP